MKIFYINILALAAAITIVIFLGKLNATASHEKSTKDYFSFNWSNPERSQTIMDYWRADEKRSNAVKKIVYLDYGFMVLYTAYFLFMLVYKGAREKRVWLKRWMRIGMACILICFLIDLIQDTIILKYVSGNNEVSDMRWYTYPKWIAFALAVFPLIIAAITEKRLRYLSQLLKSIWLFFPGILFILFPIFCFWDLGQGKDLIVAFFYKDPEKTTITFHYSRIIFFVIIAFWVYVCWYSSRIIAYIKETQQKGNAKPEIGEAFLDEFPRALGNACFLVLELAVLQLPIVHSPWHISSSAAWGIFIVLLILLHFINKWIRQKMNAGTKEQNDESAVTGAVVVAKGRTSFGAMFTTLSILLILSMLALCFFDNIPVYLFLPLLLLYHTFFIYYINLRRLIVEHTVYSKENSTWIGKKFEELLEFFCIRLEEKKYCIYFLCIAIIGIATYFLNVTCLPFARGLGPFPAVILAFSILLNFGNLITAFSVKKKVNFHFVFFLLAFVIGGLKETHYVRTKKLAVKNNEYSVRPDLKEYLTAWLKDKQISADTADTKTYDVYFVMANGGASRSGYWTAAVLDSIEDASLISKTKQRFSDHIFCLSGTSGGGVGVATFFALLRERANQKNAFYTRSAKAFLEQDYFTSTIARMLGPDFFNYIIPFSSKKDRGVVLEEAFEKSAKIESGVDTLYSTLFSENFSSFPALNSNRTFRLPILCINSTRMQDGNPAIVTNLKLDSTFNRRVDVVSLLDSQYDISMTSAAVLGARFPYLSPGGNIEDNYFVDGGYFDNSGAGVVQEMIRGIINIAKKDSMDFGAKSALYQQVKKLHFKILHITNSPVVGDSANFKRVAPIKNDLLSPILTIVGAYDMQTTVNDARLINFINDINDFSFNNADYNQIALYKTNDEIKRNEAGEIINDSAYAMNWFMSDITRNNIDNRLRSHDSLKRFIETVKAGLK